MIQLDIARVLKEKGLVARIGGIETEATYRVIKNKYIPGNLKKKLKVNAGFYGGSVELREFAYLNYLAITSADILASWDIKYQKRLLKLCNKNGSITLRDLEPFHFDENWWNLVVNSKLTVVTSFSNSFEKNIKNIEQVHPLLKSNTKTIEIVKAPDTSGSKDNFDTAWMSNLHKLVAQIKKQKPDICIIGAGAYALPAGYLLKQSGIGCIVLGGAVQLIAGIIGKRWEQRTDYSDLMNEYWMRPDKLDVPEYKNLIEGGCYW